MKFWLHTYIPSDWDISQLLLNYVYLLCIAQFTQMAVFHYIKYSSPGPWHIFLGFRIKVLLSQYLQKLRFFYIMVLLTETPDICELPNFPPSDMKCKLAYIHVLPSYDQSKHDLINATLVWKTGNYPWSFQNCSCFRLSPLNQEQLLQQQLKTQCSCDFISKFVCHLHI